MLFRSINKVAPAFTLPDLHKPELKLSRSDMQGKVWMLNVWASWCAACRDEHETLLQFSKKGLVPVLGLNYKDERKDGLGWLSKMGDPYVLSIQDYDGKLGIDYGVYGVPETFVIDKRGVIRYKQIGPLTPESLKDKLLPLVAKLDAE